MNVFIRNLGFIFLIGWNSQGFSHGEDKPGPHGGVIRMPGGFHTEVLKGDKNSFKVFLLDMAWQNPTTEDSAVAVTFVSENKESLATECKPSQGYFLCEIDKPEQFTNAKKLKVKAKRKGVMGVLAEYPLVLIK